VGFRVVDFALCAFVCVCDNRQSLVKFLAVVEDGTLQNPLEHKHSFDKSDSRRFVTPFHRYRGFCDTHRGACGSVNTTRLQALAVAGDVRTGADTWLTSKLLIFVKQVCHGWTITVSGSRFASLRFARNHQAVEASLHVRARRMRTIEAHGRY
jgi:hypothetical protein